MLETELKKMKVNVKNGENIFNNTIKMLNGECPIVSNIKISIIKEDITKLNVDCIVNAANKTLLGGGGVDGAIHRVAGFELLNECKKLREIRYKEGLPTGEAVITKGYNLPSKYVVHTAGPIYDKNKNQSNLLNNCFVNSLKLAEENNCKSIAFPAISCGHINIQRKNALKQSKMF